MSDEDDNTIIGQIRKAVALEGYQEGTDAFERRERQLKVIKCREKSGVFTCHECKFFDYCDLIKRVMREHKGYGE